MKKAAMCALVMLIAASAHAQSKTRKVDANLMALLDSVGNKIDKISSAENSIMSSGRWKAPAMLIEAAKDRYEAQKVSVNALHAVIARIKSEGVVSSIRIFGIYEMVRDVEGSVDDVATLANEITPDSPIAIELMKLKPDLSMERGKLSDAVDNSINLDSSDLAACNKPVAKKKP